MTSETPVKTNRDLLSRLRTGRDEVILDLRVNFPKGDDDIELRRMNLIGELGKIINEEGYTINGLYPVPILGDKPEFYEYKIHLKKIT